MLVRTHILTATALTFAMLAGCAVVGPGSTYGETPPKLSTDSKGLKTWTNVSSFGPVPAALQAAGVAACQPFNAIATGYHAKAQNDDGKAFPAGGYYCVAKSEDDKSTASAPSYGSPAPKLLVDSNGVKSWGNANAFGDVPAKLKASGDAACASVKGIATGYHPTAQDEQGRTLEGGGYYCEAK